MSATEQLENDFIYNRILHNFDSKQLKVAILTEKLPALKPSATDQDDLHASKVIDSLVYNDHDKTVGSITDFAVGTGKSPKPLYAMDGFLTIGGNTLDFGNTGRSSDNQAVLLDLTKNATPNDHDPNRDQ